MFVLWKNIAVFSIQFNTSPLGLSYIGNLITCSTDEGVKYKLPTLHAIPMHKVNLTVTYTYCQVQEWLTFSVVAVICLIGWGSKQ